MNAQHFLFLQGPRSPFFARLAQALRSQGHTVHKINFSLGDQAYWRLGQALNWHGNMASLPTFYANHYQRHAITDLVLFGDCRPVHRPAIAQAKQHGVRVHVFEEGYFRPHWVTLEREGVNGHSTLPKDPDWYLRQHRADPTPAERPVHFAAPFWQRATHDIAYNLCTLADPLYHRGVQNHVPYPVTYEYLAYLRRGVWVARRTREAFSITQKLLAERTRHPYYLLPLQLDSDAQIVHHSPYPNMEQAMLYVLNSFARTAPTSTRLIVKRHPLDPGFVHYRQQLFNTARTLGVAHRVFFLETGPLDTLIKASQGIVTVNSTVGSSALTHLRPVIVLGCALYALPGLTFQGRLDDFWQASVTSTITPNPQLWQAFRHVVITRTQINGGLHSDAGIRLAVANSLGRLNSNEHRAIILGMPDDCRATRMRLKREQALVNSKKTTFL